MAPTPGVDISRRTCSIIACQHAHALLQFAQLLAQRRSCHQQCLSHRQQGWVTRHQFTHTALECSLARFADLQPKATQDAAQAHLNIMALRLHQLARRQQRARLLRRQRLAMHRTKPTKPHQLRNAARVLAVGLHRHRLECSRAHAGSPAAPPQAPRPASPAYSHCDNGPASSPIRVSSSPSAAKPADQRFRLTGHLAFPHDPTRRVHHAHARAFQRHVDPRIMLHGRPPMMLGAGHSRLRQHHQSEGRPPPGHQRWPQPAGPLRHLTAAPSSR